jgi:hypothetical protein
LLWLFIFFLWYWSLNSGPIPWATPPALFCEVFFQDKVSQTICPGWLQTAIFLIYASWVARITGMSHWCLATLVIFKIGSKFMPQLAWTVILFTLPAQLGWQVCATMPSFLLVEDFYWLVNILAWLASNHYPPKLHLVSS